MIFYFLMSLLFFSLLFWFQKKGMQDQFKSLALDVMRESQESLLHLAKNVFDQEKKGQEEKLSLILDPVKETLEKLDRHHQEIEKRREGAYSAVHQQIHQLLQSEKELRFETQQLSRALKSPNVRGSWGQLHLRRVIELAGLLNKCDFFEQQEERKEGVIVRPDLIVHLPYDRRIVIDAKAPLEAYLEAMETDHEETKKTKLLLHAEHVKRHIKNLSSKEYWKQFQPTPEFVILFLPAEAFFSAAVHTEPGLIEMGMDRDVILATPTTLIALLKAVALGWKQESISREAEKIAQLGQELYDRLFTMNEHWAKVGKSLTQSVDSYNQAMASFETRVLVSARKFKDSSWGKELKEGELIEKAPR